MGEVSDEIVAAGAEIIWVLEQNYNFSGGTADNCVDFFDGFPDWDFDQGWCVGDDETRPTQDVWDDAPFAIGRGFDIIVTRHDMKIQWVSTHGTPGGNDNATGQEVLEAVEDVIDSL